MNSRMSENGGNGSFITFQLNLKLREIIFITQTPAAAFNYIITSFQVNKVLMQFQGNHIAVIETYLQCCRKLLRRVTATGWPSFETVFKRF